MTDRLVIQCNYAEGTKIAPEGARAYLALTNPGNANDRIQVLVRSHGARWVRKWESMKRLSTFRVKTLPPEHPLHGSWDLFPSADADVDREAMEEMAADLNAASARESSDRMEKP